MLVTVTVWATTIGTVLCGPAAGAQGPPPGPAALTGATVSLAPSHDVTVSGAGVVTFPAFSPDVSRYGITTTEATGGSVTLTASTSDPAGRVMVNGRLTDGSRTLSGLTPGDEIAVFIEDSAGIARHTFIYLPTGFPELVRTTPDPAPGSLHTGAVLLTLSQWVRPTPPALDSFETAVDVNGVPLFTRPGVDSLDLARQPDGHFTVFRANSAPGRTGDELVVLDDRMEPVTTRRTVGLTNTDGHDAILLPDGTAWLMAYEPRNPDGSGPVDAVIQRVDPDGSVGFQWSSAPYLAESMVAQDDYAHVNSMQVMADGDLLVSFRHLSSVFKIATSAHDGFEPEDVVWKLGGRDSDFAFPAGDGGPCAQHTARQLPNGDILMFDNGSWNLSGSMCVDPTDPSGPAVMRPQTRIVEFALDEEAGTASVVRSYAPTDWFAVFAGSAQALTNGNTLIGWAEETQALASEIDASGNLLWQIKDPSTSYPYFTYRAAQAVVPDAIDPTVMVTAPVASATYVEGAAARTGYECTDRGGSSLQTCSGPTTLDTSTPGTHTVAFTATDGAGGSTTVTRSYRVLPSTGVDVSIRKAGSRHWAGEGAVGTATTQRVRATVTRPGGRVSAKVRLRNVGALPASLTVAVTHRGSGFRLMGTGAHGLTTPVLQPGQTWLLQLTVVRRASARPRDHVVVAVTGTSRPSPLRADGVSLRVDAARP